MIAVFATISALVALVCYLQGWHYGYMHGLTKAIGDIYYRPESNS